VYVRPEDEFFHQQAAAAFTFPVEGRAVGKDELQPLRLVMLLPANKVPAARCETWHIDVNDMLWATLLLLLAFMPSWCWLCCCLQTRCLQPGEKERTLASLMCGG
jgi:hypothetical protein